MKILLVNGAFPTTYWGFQHAMAIAGTRASLPPLGLITLAALLPKSWELSLVDLNVEELPDDALRRADAVFVSGMLVQIPSMLEVVRRAQALGRPCVVGGPAVGASPERFTEADVVFMGEAEGRAHELEHALAELAAHGLRSGVTAAPIMLAPSGERPDIATSPVPRFDLLRREHYVSMSVQFSRGCPYACEFCDVTTQFGRTPRVKAPAQMLRELTALLALGYRGSIFLVDDNFIGNKRAVRAFLPELHAWQVRQGRPFDFYTEATVTLASDQALVAAMVAAGFTSVFLGIETPSKAALAETKKNQNVHLDLDAAVMKLTRAGLEVMSGFIVGFDSDDETIFEAQRDFISRLPIPMAMVGVLGALPGTPLYHRLAREGRLRTSADGDQFTRPNFDTAMDEHALLKGYAGLLEALYNPDAYYARCHAYLAGAADAKMPKRAPTWRELRGAVRVAWHVGVKSPRRGHFWRLVRAALKNSPDQVPRALVQAVQGEHFIRYTEEDVLPRLAEAIAEVERERRTHRRAEPSALPIAVGLSVLPESADANAAPLAAAAGSFNTPERAERPQVPLAALWRRRAAAPLATAAVGAGGG